MPNPYDNIFGDSSEKDEPSSKPTRSFQIPEDAYKEYEKEPLDEILLLVNEFQKKAGPFSEILTHARAVDHKVEKPLIGKFIILDDPHDKGNLFNERAYYGGLEKDFFQIINPMKELAEIHLKCVRQFNLHIDKDYYSVDKTKAQIRSEIDYVIDGINLQRKILSDAAEDLIILKEAMEQTEKRFKKYINAGGKNNISESEVELIVRKRETLTSGLKHNFDYSFFKINLLDKTAISLGFFMKETTSQYLKKMGKALENR